MRNQSRQYFTRGGQVTLHNLRMWMQISNKIALCALIVFLTVSSTIIWFRLTSYERYVFSEYLWGKALFFDPSVKTEFIYPSGQKLKIRYQDLIKSTLVNQTTHHVTAEIMYASLVGAAAAAFSILAITGWLKRKGKLQTEDKFKRGDKFMPKNDTQQIIMGSKQNSDLTLSGLPLIKGKETRHLFFHGSTGTGKSTGIKELLDKIRARGDRVIIYDKSCNFLTELYEPRTDSLLNPLDTRSLNWDMWCECRDSADFDSVAASLIPISPSDKDPFWAQAARMIFASAAFEMRNDDDRSMVKLLRYLFTTDLDVLERHLKGTLAQTLVSRKAEKTTANIKIVMSTYLRSLKYVKEGKNPFSIRKWVQDEKTNSWLFITSLGDRHEVIKSLITAWLDIAVNALLSLTPNEERRIWIVLDELNSLQRLPYLAQSLAEARKFGGCFVLGVQNIAQLQGVYGMSGAMEISSLLNTRFLFRQTDPNMAKWSAENFGETIVEEVHEGISYGANSMRDGISINRVETRKPLISYSEMMSLADLYCYVRLPGEYPVTKIDFTYKKRAQAQNGFILREINEDQMKEIDTIIDKHKGFEADNEQIVAANVEDKGSTKDITPEDSNEMIHDM